MLTKQAFALAATNPTVLVGTAAVAVISFLAYEHFYGQQEMMVAAYYAGYYEGFTDHEEGLIDETAYLEGMMSLS